jgi:L-threonylcarbamoyladenylate synthase
MSIRKNLPKACGRRTKVLKVDPDNPAAGAIRRAAGLIRSGGLVAFPTETVYGIAANLSDKRAVERLREVKARDRGKPFTVHIADVGTIEEMGCVVTPGARRLIDKFWPGPLTIILKSKKGRKTGFRMPANRVALELIKAAGVPIVAPSANISGKAPPTDAEGVLKELGGMIELIVDSGPTAIGVESTVVDLAVSPPKVLREGAIGDEEIYRVAANGKTRRYIPNNP